MFKKHNLINRITLFSIILNVLLFLLKLIVGILNNSISLIADAWHTLGDSISSLAILMANKLSKKPADSEHPFGHARFEVIAVVLVAGMLIFVGFDFFIKSIVSFVEKQKGSNYKVSFLIVSLISILIKEVIAQVTIYYSNVLNSSMLKADAYHHRSDALSSVILVLGYFLQDFIPYIDSILGIIISVFIIKVAISMLKENAFLILGSPVPQEILEKIKKISINLFGNTLEMHHFHYHDYLTHKELSFHIRIDGEIPLKKAHAISSLLEKEIKEKLDIDCTIHVEPYKHLYN